MKAKFKIAQLAAKPLELELVHPKHGETGIVITLVGPHSQKFRDAIDAYRETEGTAQDNLALMASTVVGWDEEAFDGPATPENVMALLGDPVNEWIVTQVSEKIRDSASFFQ